MPHTVSYLVTGGSRSGKSTFALELASKASKPFFIATGWAGDKEMQERIVKHKKERGEHWSTIEEKTNIPSAISEAVSKGADFIVVDCLTLWVSNLLFENIDIEKMLVELVDLIPKVPVPLVFVTNEVGSGIVPENELARRFRDCAGMVNRKVAAATENVVLTVCGIPLFVKGENNKIK